MEYKLDKGAHSVYALQYHFVQVVKYRKAVFLDNKIIDFLKQKTKEISTTFDVDIINWKGSIHRTPFHLTNKGSSHRTLF